MHVVKTKALISFAVTTKLICVFVFKYAKRRFSHNEALMSGPDTNGPLTRCHWSSRYVR